MKRLLYITTIIFGVLSGLFMLNRFYDLLDQADTESLFLIAAYCSQGLIILGTGLILFSKKIQMGFWLLLIFEGFLIVKHTIEFKNYKLTDQAFSIPKELMESWTIPFYDYIFYTEFLFGLTAIIILIKENKRKTVANKG